MNGFNLLVITPHKKIYDKETSMISLKNSNGEFSILAEHENLITPTLPGKLTITTDDNNVLEYFASGGILKVKDGTVVLCADTVETKEEIDVKRAEMSKEKAESKLKDEKYSNEGIDELRTRLALSRAMERIDFASKK
ncbi:MAG: ATP synthase F1 subunit epsilon [Clostridium sp.]|uniref:ATP synthase F1 subunit epsilon n=1 Tax=Clostridium sp. TaxID=1506 RepID=UPI003F2EDA91